MENKKVYNKLVRDRIPEIIEKQGNSCKVQTLNDTKYLQKLHEKLAEELDEYLVSGQLEELADLLEVMIATARARGCSWEQVCRIREEKYAQRGGFEKKILLQEVTERL